MEYLFSVAAVLQALLCFRLVGQGRSRAVYLIYLEIIYNLFIKFLVGNAGLPSVLNYAGDVILLWILGEFLLSRRGKLRRIPKSMVLCGGLLLGLSLVSYALNLYSPLLYLWGLRNNFRFLLFAMLCAVYLEQKDLKILMDVLFSFFITNLIIVFYQFFFVPCQQWSPGDFMSGLFSNGTQRGGNASLSWLACIVCTWEAIRYLNGHEKPWRLLFVWIATSCIASMTEIKLLFLQQLMIAGLSVLLCRKSRRSIWMVLLAGSSFFVGVQLLYLLYPGFDNFFLPNILAGYITRDDLFPNMQSGDSSGLNRLTAISYMLENFLHTWPQRLFGIGLGNGDYSKFSFLTSDFYRLHWDLPYTFFSSAMVTLELGLVGLGAYCLWFFNFIRRALCCHPKTEPDRSAVSMTIILGLMVYVMILSNQTMKLETTSYLVGCVLTFPFLITEKKEV